MIETKIYKAATDDEKRIALSSSLIYARWRNLEGCPREAGFDDITCLQIDLMRWERKNFGLAKSYTSALGIIEEIGELEDAQDDEDEWADAIGDSLIFACSLCSKNALDFGTMFDAACGGKLVKMDGMLGKLGKLAHVTLKADQGIRHYADRDVARRDIGIVLYRVVSSVVRYALLCGHDPREIMAEAAGEVMKREWWADPGMGVPMSIGVDKAPGADSVRYMLVGGKRVAVYDGKILEPTDHRLLLSLSDDPQYRYFIKDLICNRKGSREGCDCPIVDGVTIKCERGNFPETVSGVDAFVAAKDEREYDEGSGTLVNTDLTDEQVQSFKSDGLCWKRRGNSVCILEEGHAVACGWELDACNNWLSANQFGWNCEVHGLVEGDAILGTSEGYRCGFRGDPPPTIDDRMSATIDHTLMQGLGKLPTSEDLFEAIFEKFPKIGRIDVISDPRGCNETKISITVDKASMSIPGFDAGIRECMDRIGLSGFSFEVVERKS